MARIRVEVVRALPERAEVRALSLPAGATVRDALLASGMSGDTVGVFGRQAEAGQVLHDGDRVEIYRPLENDPKEARRLRARRRR